MTRRGLRSPQQLLRGMDRAAGYPRFSSASVGRGPINHPGPTARRGRRDDKFIAQQELSSDRSPICSFPSPRYQRTVL
jgi:hypothetical protein